MPDKTRIRVKEFFIEESRMNPPLKVLIAIDENDKEWVVSGDCWNPTYMIEYESAFDTQKIIS
jgi:hypothetical protein